MTTFLQIARPKPEPEISEPEPEAELEQEPSMELDAQAEDQYLLAELGTTPPRLSSFPTVLPVVVPKLLHVNRSCCTKLTPEGPTLI